MRFQLSFIHLQKHKSAKLISVETIAHTGLVLSLRFKTAIWLIICSSWLIVCIFEFYENISKTVTTIFFIRQKHFYSGSFG